MSGIFGIFNRNGKPVEEKTVNTMLDAMSYWDPDERNTWVDGPVALGHTMLWNTPESKYEHLPLKKDAYILTMDARIDNRDELLKELVLPDRPMEEIGDSEFILAAYRKWGEDCPKHLLGDFAFVIWDEEKQQIFCARDHVGIKSFYYYLDDEKFVFANHIQGIVSHPQIVKTISDKSIATYLIYEQLIDPEITFFESIHQLSPAQVMVISSETVKEKKYWCIEESPTVDYNSLEEYSDKLFELLEDAVQVRVRSDYTVVSHLSGGLDSSSIAVLASRFLQSNGEQLHAYNWMPYPENGEDITYHEWGNSIKIAEKEHIIHHSLSMNISDIKKIYETHDISLNDTITFWYEHLVQKSAKKINTRIILSGWGGDELITYDSQGYVSGLFWRGDILGAIQVILSTIQSPKRRYINLIKKVYHTVFLPLLPHWIYCRLTNYPCGTKDNFKYINNTIVKQIEKIKLQKRHIKRIGSREERLSSFRHGYIQTRINSWNTSGYSNNIEYRYPLLDKRIVEFSMGIPENLYHYEEKGYGRFLFRCAVKGILTDEIRWSNTKPEPSRVNLHYVLLYKAQQEWMKKIRNKTIVDNKYVNIELLLKDIEDFKISMPVLSNEEIDKLSQIENAILLLRIGSI